MRRMRSHQTRESSFSPSMIGVSARDVISLKIASFTASKNPGELSMQRMTTEKTFACGACLAEDGRRVSGSR